MLATGMYTDARLARLRAPAADASGVRSVLADAAIGGFEVTTVTDRPEHEVRRKVHGFLLARRPRDLVVVYLSSHGLRDARGQLYFAAADTDRDQLASTAMSADWLLDRLEECLAHRQVLILDCCFSGAFDRRAKGTDADVDLERMLAGGRGRVVLTASRATEYSFEGELLREGGSVFTAALVQGLRTGDADRTRRGVVTVEDAFQYAAAKVRENRSDQTPQRWMYGGEGDIILARNPRGAKVVPAALPESLELSLNSPYPSVRQGAVQALGEWLSSDELGQAETARRTLKKIAEQDSPTVAAAARALLSTIKKPSARTPQPPAVRPPKESRQRTVAELLAEHGNSQPAEKSVLRRRESTSVSLAETLAEALTAYQDASSAPSTGLLDIEAKPPAEKGSKPGQPSRRAEPGSGPARKVLLVYLVVHATADMPESKVQDVNRIVSQVTRRFRKDPHLSGAVRCSLVIFSDRAQRASLPVDISGSHTFLPVSPDGSGTSFSAVFRLLREVVRPDINALATAGHAVGQALVVMTAHGDPAEPESVWQSRYSEFVEAMPVEVTMVLAGTDAGPSIRTLRWITSDRGVSKFSTFTRADLDELLVNFITDAASATIHRMG